MTLSYHADLLVEAAKKLDQDAEVVAVEWKSETRQEFQHKAQNIEKNGPTAEKVPDEAYKQVVDAEILLTHFCPVPEDLIEAGKKLTPDRNMPWWNGTCRYCSGNEEKYSSNSLY